jgi:hypothetical protein
MTTITKEEIAYLRYVQYWLALEARLNTITLS